MVLGHFEEKVNSINTDNLDVKFCDTRMAVFSFSGPGWEMWTQTCSLFGR